MAKKEQIKIAHRFWADRKEKLSISGVSVATDWFSLLGFLVLLLVVLLVSSWLLFRDVSSASLLDATVDATQRTHVNEAQLSRVVERFTVKQEQFRELSNNFTFTSVSLGDQVQTTDSIGTTTQNLSEESAGFDDRQ